MFVCVYSMCVCEFVLLLLFCIINNITIIKVFYVYAIQLEQRENNTHKVHAAELVLIEQCIIN